MGNGRKVNIIEKILLKRNAIVFVVKESGVGGTARKANKNLRSRVQQLEEENNLLRLKYEILLNMVSNF